MKLRTKKKIAREFLTLVLCIAISISAYLLTSASNYYYKSRITKLSIASNEISQKFDSLQNTYSLKDEKHSWFHDIVQGEFSDAALYPQLSKQSLWNRLAELSKKDSISHKWLTIWSTGSNRWKDIFMRMGFENPEELKTFIDSYSFDENDSANFRSAQLLRDTWAGQRKEIINIRHKLYSQEEQRSIIRKTFIIALFFLFLIRYFIYSLIWSINTLRYEQDDPT